MNGCCVSSGGFRRNQLGVHELDSIDSAENGNGQVSLPLLLNITPEADDADEGLNLKVASLELARHIELARAVALDRAVGESRDDLDEVRHAFISETLRETPRLSGHDEIGASCRG